MSSNYSCTIFLSIAILAVLTILVHENGRIKIKEKHRFYLAYLAIALAALAEWFGIALNTAPLWTLPLHVVAKGADYILTPLAAFMFVRQLGIKTKLDGAMTCVMAVNIVLQILSGFTGIIYYVDHATNIYGHGPMHFIYVIIYVISFIYILYGFTCYGKQYRKRNRLSIIAMLAVVLAAVFAQEFGNGAVRISYIALAAGSALEFIHFSEFAQQRIDEALTKQKMLLDTDVLTGLLSRYAYTDHLEKYAEEGNAPANMAVFVVDINGLKEVNDTLGHKAGDDFIQAASECVRKVMEPYGKCFRTGGDEFVTILELEEDKVHDIVQKLQHAVDNWHGKSVRNLSVSVGYATNDDCPDGSVEDLVLVADKRMYENKAAYYKKMGKERRAR